MGRGDFGAGYGTSAYRCGGPGDKTPSEGNHNRSAEALRVESAQQHLPPSRRLVRAIRLSSLVRLQRTTRLPRSPTPRLARVPDPPLDRTMRTGFALGNQRPLMWPRQGSLVCPHLRPHVRPHAPSPGRNRPQRGARAAHQAVRWPAPRRRSVRACGRASAPSRPARPEFAPRCRVAARAWRSIAR